MKDRLIELLGKADEATEILTRDFPSYEEELKAFYTGIANYLLDNGVIVLPCAVGDTVYVVGEYGIGGVKEYEVGCIVLKGNADYSRCLWEDVYGGGIGNFEDIGKTVFLTKEEAERKLKELESEVE